MEISEKTLAAVKKVVFEIFDNGKVKDVSMRLGYDSVGEQVIRVRLYVLPGTGVKDYTDRLFYVPEKIREVLEGDLKDLPPHVEVRTV